MFFSSLKRSLYFKLELECCNAKTISLYLMVGGATAATDHSCSSLIFFEMVTIYTRSWFYLLKEI